MIFACTFNALIDTDGTSASYIFSTEAFHTQALGTPANTPAYPRLVQPGNLTRSIASGRRLFGITEAGYGEVVLQNADGAFDALPTYGTAGQTISMYCQDGGDSPWKSFPLGFTLIFAARITSVVGDGDLLRIRVKELFDDFAKPMCPLFLGTGGLEGDAALAGTPKPVVFGGCMNISPTLINAQQLVYMVSGRGEVSAHHAKDSGSVIARALTAGAQELDAYADYAALAAATVPIGHYATVTTDSVFGLGSTPVGQVTCDALEYDGTDPYTSPSDVIRALFDAGNTSGLTRDTAAFIVFKSWNDANNSQSACGFFAHDTTTTYADAMSAIASSVGAWVGFDKDGAFTIGRIVDPSTMTPAITLTENDIMSVRRVAPEDGSGGVPFANIVLRYPKNWTQQTSGLAGVVPEDVRGELREEFPLSATYECIVPSDANPLNDVPVATQFVGAADYIMDGYAHGRRVTSTGDIEAYVTRGTDAIAGLIGVPRDWFDVVVPFTETLLSDLDIGICVSLTHTRHGLSAGKQFLVTGIRYELSGAPTATLTLWG